MSSHHTTVNTDYSPLNKCSSSGEDIEQFSLPLSSSNQYSRSKKRRKRKEFDSFKSRTLDPMTGAHLCRCGSCVLATVIVILIACICGLSVVLFYVSNTVTDMEKRVNNLQVAKETVSSSLLELQSKFHSVTDLAERLDKLSTNYTGELDSLHNIIGSLQTQLQSVNTELERDNKLPKQEDLENIQQELARLGSEILALKTDSASLKQQNLSINGRLSELDVSMSTARREQLSSVPSTTTESTEQAQKESLSVSNKRIEEGIVTLNQSVSALKLRLDSIQSEADTSAKFTDFIDRLDTFETRLTEIHDWQIEGATNSFEHDVVNLTITAGIEEAISDIINNKVSRINELAKNAFIQTGQLKSELGRVEHTLDVLGKLFKDSVSDGSQALPSSNATTAVVNSAVQTTMSLRTIAANGAVDGNSSPSQNRNQSTPITFNNTNSDAMVNSTTRSHNPVDVSQLDLKTLLQTGGG